MVEGNDATYRTPSVIGSVLDASVGFWQVFEVLSLTQEGVADVELAALRGCDTLEPGCKSLLSSWSTFRMWSS
jgi:hypothetical protein